MCFSKVGLAVGVTVCLLRRKKMAKKEGEKEVEMDKTGVVVEEEDGAAQADMGNFERILLE